MRDERAVHSLLQEYIPDLTSYNELFSGGEFIRPDWQTFLNSLSNLGEEEIKIRADDIKRLLKENGVAYNVYNDPSGQTRPWELDPIPQIITANEWETISAGLIQRATLFDLLLKDIYGEQLVIRKGILPQELIYLHPGFIRQCVNIIRPSNQFLTLYAADMARGSDGRLWVISDRSQAPSGAGYALENRYAMSSILPELFTNLHVKRLSPYFDALQQSLTHIAPHNSDNPRVVILTPGPENETYFEHSYLASYLGISLVQGNDLMVKDNYVWLKTIDGLEKVDVILRRVDDVYCDPLELKSDSLLGVAGLLHVVRKGNVSIANPLGSSVIENSGLVPFLPALSKYFLDRDLIMPSIATWWCGQSIEMNYVIENMKSLVIKKIFRSGDGNHSTVDGATLSSKEQHDLTQKIKSNPYLYVGQEKIDFSASPAAINGRIVAGHSLIRTFLVANNQSYVVMPGGLTRTNISANYFNISNQLGDFSKDTWVLSADYEREQPISMQLHSDVNLKRNVLRSLPSHTAENLFWVGRYTERVISNARLQRTVMQHMVQNNNAPDFKTSEVTTILLQALTQCTYTFPGFFEEDDEEKAEELFADPWVELEDVLYNDNRVGSLSNNISLLKHSVYSVRNFWAVDTWRVLRQMEDHWNMARKENRGNHLKMIGSIDALNTSMFAVLGMNRESVRREQGWNIMDMGRKLEQAMYTITLLKSFFTKKVAEPAEHDLLEAVMTAGQSLITYRYTYQDHIQLPLALELLILDINYPKSLAYLVKKIKRYIALLPNESVNTTLTPKQRNIHEADTLIKLANVHDLAQHDLHTDQFKSLHVFLDKLYQLLADTSTLISKTYFTHSKVQKQLFTVNFI